MDSAGFLSVPDRDPEAWLQFAGAYGTHDVPRFTLFPMSQFAHFIMFESYIGVGAVRIPSHKILTHFADIPVARAS